MTKLEVLNEELKRLHELRLEALRSQVAFSSEPKLCAPSAAEVTYKDGIFTAVGDAVVPYLLEPKTNHVWETLQEDYAEVLRQLGDIDAKD